MKYAVGFAKRLPRRAWLTLASGLTLCLLLAVLAQVERSRSTRPQVAGPAAEAASLGGRWTATKPAVQPSRGARRPLVVRQASAGIAHVVVHAPTGGTHMAPSPNEEGRTE